jgi:hypothetical protein
MSWRQSGRHDRRRLRGDALIHPVTSRWIGGRLRWLASCRVNPGRARSRRDRPWRRASLAASVPGGGHPWRRASLAAGIPGAKGRWRRASLAASIPGGERPWRRASLAQRVAGAERPWRPGRLSRCVSAFSVLGRPIPLTFGTRKPRQHRETPPARRTRRPRETPLTQGSTEKLSETPPTQGGPRDPEKPSRHRGAPRTPRNSADTGEHREPRETPPTPPAPRNPRNPAGTPPTEKPDGRHITLCDLATRAGGTESVRPTAPTQLARKLSISSWR